MTQTPAPAASARKTTRADEVFEPRVEQLGDTWHIRSYETVKQVLRASQSTTQAGFNCEMTIRRRPNAKHPVLFQDGEEHKRQRAKIARFFAPATVSKKYHAFMEELADELVGQVARGGIVDLPVVTMRYSVAVAAQVVGLTESDLEGMSRRLQTFFEVPHLDIGDNPSRFDRLLTGVALLRVSAPMMRFRKHDVLPAIKARRAEPQEDVISHLLAEGYSDEEILIECVTYGAAGMITTREFISMVTWHMLQDEELRRTYLAADQKARYRILDEILRLEPVVGHLYRRATEDLTLVDGDQTYAVPAGAMLDLYIRGANADEEAVGADPLQICPMRETAASVRPEAMGFGDGVHVCPGNAIATQETDLFLTRLLALDLELVGEPRIEWDELIKGYAVRDLRLRVRA